MNYRSILTDTVALFTALRTQATPLRPASATTLLGLFLFRRYASRTSFA